MSMIFKLRALSDENDHFYRDYELMYDSRLLDLHTLICSDLGFDTAAPASFFSSDAQWNKLEEFTLIDMGLEGDGAPRSMESVPLGRVVGNSGDRLIYLFDEFGGRALYLEMAGSYKAADGMAYPRVASWNGAPPAQFDALGGGSIFDEAMDEFGDFEGDDLYDDDL